MTEFDFISEYKRLVREITDTPDDFIEASALFLISTFAGRKFAIYTTPEIQIYRDEHGGKLLNVWFIFLGKTRVSRKSTIIDKVEQYIEEIAPEIALPKDFTPESLISELAERTINGVTHVAWVHDEVSQFFEALKKKDYMASTDALLSRIYDGRDYFRSTVSRGREVVKRPYLTVLVASTDVLPTYFSELHIRQGFLNRFLYIVPERGKLQPLKFNTSDTVREEFRELGDNWLKELYHMTDSIVVDLSGEAKKQYYEFESWIDQKILNEDLGIREGFYGNLPNSLLKLAALYRISRMSPAELQNPKYLLPVEEEDVTRALTFLKKAEKWFNNVIRLMKTSTQRKNVIVDEGDLEYIVSIIEKHGGEMKLQDLVAESQLINQKVQVLLDTLATAGRIKWVRIKSGGRGRPAIGVRLVKK